MNEKIPGHNNFLIVGCGELGSRHAQSLSRLGTDVSLSLVDPSEESLLKTKMRILEGGFSGKMTFHESTENLAGEFELGIFSTSATHRLDSFRKAYSGAMFSSVLLEKILSLDSEELDFYDSRTIGGEVGSWVNLPMPYYGHFKREEGEIMHNSKASPLKYHVLGSNLGLVTNFIHYLDHFQRLCHDRKLTVRFSEASRKIESKRSGYQELLGKIEARTVEGDELSVLFKDELAEPFLEITISTGDLVWKFDEINGVLTKHNLIADSKVSHYKTPFQSELTHISVQRIRRNLSPFWCELKRATALHRRLDEALDPIRKRLGALKFT
jgi:hypothetical protein